MIVRVKCPDCGHIIKFTEMQIEDIQRRITALKSQEMKKSEIETSLDYLMGIFGMNKDKG